MALPVYRLLVLPEEPVAAVLLLADDPVDPELAEAPAEPPDTPLPLTEPVETGEEADAAADSGEA